jgi:beta-galactosidase
MNGANSSGKDYQPDTTSYDYDAPLDERGEPRDKYFAFRKVIAETTGTTPPPVLPPTRATTFPVADGLRTASLWRNLPTPKRSKKLLTFEDLDQSYGYVLYRTGLDVGQGGRLLLDGLHDYAQVYVDQRLVGTLDRRLGTNTLDLPAPAQAATLDILVENSGRVNYTAVIRTERKGITGSATLDGKPLAGWEIYSLPMDNLGALRFLPEPCDGPCFYQTQVNVATPADTYFDTRGLHKGMLWLNSRPLGRFWSIGPQFALYAPGPWFDTGSNTVTFFDLMGSASDRLRTVATPVFAATVSTRD